MGAEMSASSAHISMHELEYSLTFLGLADDRRAAFSIVLVGNRIADSAFIFAALVNVAGKYRSARSWLASKPSPRLLNNKERSHLSTIDSAWSPRTGQLDDATDWCTKALAMGEDIGDRQGTVITCHQLGNVVTLRERAYDARD